MEVESLKSLLNVENDENELILLSAVHLCMKDIIDQQEIHLFCQPCLKHNIYRFLYSFLYDANDKALEVVEQKILSNCLRCVIKYKEARTVLIKCLSSTYDTNGINDLYMEYIKWDGMRIVHQTSLILNKTLSTSYDYKLCGIVIFEVLYNEHDFFRCLPKNDIFFPTIQKFIQYLDSCSIQDVVQQLFYNQITLKYFFNCLLSSNKLIIDLASKLWSSKPCLKSIESHQHYNTSNVFQFINNAIKQWNTDMTLLLEKNIVLNHAHSSTLNFVNQITNLVKAVTLCLQFTEGYPNQVSTKYLKHIFYSFNMQILQLSQLARYRQTVLKISSYYQLYKNILEFINNVFHLKFFSSDFFTIFTDEEVLDLIDELVFMIRLWVADTIFNQHCLVYVKELLFCMVINPTFCIAPEKALNKFIRSLNNVWNHCSRDNQMKCLYIHHIKKDSMDWVYSHIMWSILGLDCHAHMNLHKDGFHYIQAEQVDFSEELLQSSINFKPIIYQRQNQLYPFLYKTIVDFNSNMCLESTPIDLIRTSMISLNMMFSFCLKEFQHDYITYELILLLVNFYVYNQPTVEISSPILQAYRYYPRSYVYLKVIHIYVLKFMCLCHYSSEAITSLILSQFSQILVLPDFLHLIPSLNETKKVFSTYPAKESCLVNKIKEISDSSDDSNTIFSIFRYKELFNRILYILMCCTTYCFRNILYRLCSYRNEDTYKPFLLKYKPFNEQLNNTFEAFFPHKTKSIFPLLDINKLHHDIEDLLKIKDWLQFPTEPSYLINLAESNISENLFNDTLINIFFTHFGLLLNSNIPKSIHNLIFDILSIILNLRSQLNECSVLKSELLKNYVKESIIKSVNKKYNINVPSLNDYDIYSLIIFNLKEKSYDIRHLKLFKCLNEGFKFTLKLWDRILNVMKSLERLVSLKFLEGSNPSNLFIWNHPFIYFSNFFFLTWILDPYIKNYNIIVSKFDSLSIEIVDIVTNTIINGWTIVKQCLNVDQLVQCDMTEFEFRSNKSYYSELGFITYSEIKIAQKTLIFFYNWIQASFCTLNTYIKNANESSSLKMLGKQTYGNSVESNHWTKQTHKITTYFKHDDFKSSDSLCEYPKYLLSIINYFVNDTSWINKLIKMCLHYQGYKIQQHIDLIKTESQINLKYNDVILSIQSLKYFKLIQKMFSFIYEASNVIVKKYRYNHVKVHPQVVSLSKGRLNDCFSNYIKKQLQFQGAIPSIQSVLDPSLLMNEKRTISHNSNVNKSTEKNKPFTDKELLVEIWDSSRMKRTRIVNPKIESMPLKNKKENIESTDNRSFNPFELKKKTNENVIQNEFDIHPIKKKYSIPANYIKPKVNSTILVTSPDRSQYPEAMKYPCDKWQSKSVGLSDTSLRTELYRKAFQELYIYLAEIMQWNVFNLEKHRVNVPDFLKDGLPSSFVTIEQFKSFFTPLLMEECRCSLLQSINDTKLTGFPISIIGTTRADKSIILTIKSTKMYTDESCLEASYFRPDDEIESSDFKKSPDPIPFHLWDLILLLPTADRINWDGKYLPDIYSSIKNYILCIVDKDDDNDLAELELHCKKNVLFRLRTPYQFGESVENSVSKFPTARISINSKWIAFSISSLGTNIREFQSLWVSELSSLFSYILNPLKYLHSPSINQDSTFYEEKLSSECIDFLHRNSSNKCISELFEKNGKIWLNRCLCAIKNEMGLNDYQNQAICHSLTVQPPVALLQGPPGTGKTKVIIGILTTLYNFSVFEYGKMSKSSENRLKILVCAPSNAAVDEIIVRILNQGIMSLEDKPKKYLFPKCLRIGHPQRITQEKVIQISLNVLVNKMGDQEEKKKKEEIAIRKQEFQEKIQHLERQIKELDLSLDSSNPSQDHSNPDKLKSASQASKQLISEKRCVQKNISLLKEKFDNEFKTIRNNCQDNLLNDCDIIFSTLSGSATECLTGIKIDFVIIDEAAQAVELSSLIPLRLNPARIILVGDPQQLPATVISKIAKNYAYEKSLFQRLQECKVPTRILSVQYRMHPLISEFPSMHFYNNHLMTAESLKNQKWSIFHEWAFLFRPIIFFNLPWKPSNKNYVNSFSNEIEAFFIQNLLNLFSKYFIDSHSSRKCIDWSDICILTPYRQQLIELCNLFDVQKESYDDNKPHICTIDSFQGREKRIIILSCVRSNTDNIHQHTTMNNNFSNEFDTDEFSDISDELELGEIRSVEFPSNTAASKKYKEISELGFVADQRRLNVAITRAQESLWIVGNATTLKHNKSWKSLINHYMKTSYSSTSRYSDHLLNTYNESAFVDVLNLHHFFQSQQHHLKHTDFSRIKPEIIISDFFSHMETYNLTKTKSTVESHQSLSKQTLHSPHHKNTPIYHNQFNSFDDQLFSYRRPNNRESSDSLSTCTISD